MNVGFAPEAAYLFMLIFARVGTLVMLMPGIGERMAPARVRLGLALMLSLVLYPLVSPGLPPLREGYEALAVVFAHEIAVGFILGGIARMIVLATQTAGATIAFQSGLSMAQTADPSQGGVQGAIIGSFLSIVGVTLIFATDLHHLVLAAIAESYEIYPPDMPIMFDDAAQAALGVLVRSFAVGVQMAAPFIVFGLVFYLGLGLLARLMPQLQVFFIAMPANISIGLILLGLVLTVMMGWYLNHFVLEINMLRGR